MALICKDKELLFSSFNIWEMIFQNGGIWCCTVFKRAEFSLARRSKWFLQKAFSIFKGSSQVTWMKLIFVTNITKSVGVKFSLQNTAVDPGVGRNYRSRPFSGILASNFRTESQEWNFPLPFPFPKKGMEFSLPFPFPKIGNGISHSRSRYREWNIKVGNRKDLKSR